MSFRSRKTYAPLALAISLFSAGCASSSIERDLDQVSKLSHTEAAPRVVEGEVDPAPAEDAQRLLEQPLDADAAVRVALLNNRELRAVLREMGISRGKLVQAGLLPNPVVEAELLPERNTSLELRVEYDITGAVLAPMRARAAKPDVLAARLRAAAAVVELGYRVRAAFYRYQSADQKVAIAEQVLDGYAASREAAQAMLLAGNIAELDVASQEVAYERARVLVAELTLDLVEEKESLQRLLGVHGEDTEWDVQGELPRAPENTEIPDDVETRVLRASLDLQEARSRLDGLGLKAGFTRKAGAIPDVAVDLHGLWGDPETAEGIQSEPEWRFGAGVSVGVPLFDRSQGTVLSLEAEFDALMERYYGMAVDLRSSARATQSRVRSAHARAVQYQNVIVPAQRRVTEQTMLQYNAMQLGIFHVIEARREELDVKLAQVETLREYWTAKAELEALLAGRSVSPAGGTSGNRATLASKDTEGGH